jgi:anthraniloyl-CoA monooxygenase
MAQFRINREMAGGVAAGRPLKIACAGGGPGGLYFAVLMKQANPGHQIAVYERNRPDDTFGFGVVFSDATMGYLSEQDQRSYPEIMDASMHWQPIEVRHRGEVLRCDNVGFSAIERKMLLNILQRQARDAGVELHFEHEVPDLAAFEDHELVVAADGVNSTLRNALADRFRPQIEMGSSRFVWFGTDKRFDCLTFFYVETDHGAFGAHIYPYADDRSTFIVETDEETWRRAGMDVSTEHVQAPGLTDVESLEYCERIFADHLEGHRLLGNNSKWLAFPTLRNAAWSHGNVVLIGDAAHTAHFSVGSGTKMAMEDAVALAQHLQRDQDIATALREYELERRPRVEHIQRMARTSFEWWATFRHYLKFDPEQFAFHYLTRGQFRYDSLVERDKRFVERVERWADRSGQGLLEPCRVAGLELPNRVVAMPSPFYMAASGVPGEGHRQELLGLARSGAGLILTEVAAVSESGRITPGDVGIYTDEQASAWNGVVDSVHEATTARIGLCLSHAGPRGATRPRTAGVDRPLPDGAWPLVAASAVAYGPGQQVPAELDERGMAEVRDDFGRAAERAAACGFDLLLLDFAHGYLLAGFISPLTNLRKDAYAGSLENRLRFPLEVLDAVRRVWTPGRPLAVAISASDWRPGGVDGDDALRIAAMLREHGCDIVAVQSGWATPDCVPNYARCYQMFWSGRIRHEAGVPTIAAGGIGGVADLNTVILSGRADLCVIDSGRPLALR